MAEQTRSAPFSRAVFKAMRTLYPENLADKSWDNTGLLLEAPFNSSRRPKNSVLLTVDLTKAVANEAIENKAAVVVAYHPIIFRGLKSLTMGDTQQTSLLRLASEGISVYSPHTALDSAPGGINDWLADIVTGDVVDNPSSVQAPGEEASRASADYGLFHHPLIPAFKDNTKFKPAAIDHERQVIKAVEVETHPGAGQGRIVRFKNPQPLSEFLTRLAAGFGSPKAFSIAIPQGSDIANLSISSVGMCAGSGGSLLNPLNDIDVLLTGELSHHEALSAIENGKVVITLFHSNTERGFLRGVLQAQLKTQIEKDWKSLRSEESSVPGLEEALNDTSVEVIVSKNDRDPYGILVAS